MTSIANQIKFFMDLNLTLFYNKINNKIDIAKVNQTEFTYINIDYSVSQGFQTGLKYSLYPNLTWKVGVVLTGRKEDQENDDYEASEFFYTTDVTSSITYSIIKFSLDFSVFYKYTGKTPQNELDLDENLVQGYVPAYNSMDMSVIKNLLNRRLQVSVGVKNLFNNTILPPVGGSSGEIHSGGDNPIAWGRTVFLRAAYTFKKF